ncbi:M56 family metallopeptidase [Maribacter halichondriae]|uniref:M56 family metallopeptidase n=1 Tax=Maribacter halichondriae TaxID=2980554 RepID=UPI002358EB9C|nr:M56 family metallopeptidase [Maribacter sp. Hal144]
MEAFIPYILKVSCILALFCGTYLLFLKNETFFKFNRYFLLSGILIAIALPCVEVTRYVEIESVVGTTMFMNNFPNTFAASVSAKPIDWSQVFFIVYGIGVMVFSTKFIIQLVSLFRMVDGNIPRKFGDYYYVETSLDIAPFSFFKYIFYNPSLYTESELSAIIKHEVVHSSQWHSADVLFAHLITILTWVNPFSWLYRTCVKQNLEFLADQAATKESVSLSNYQYTLLKVSGNQYCTSIVNTFYNSLIKKRIVMLNKSKSNNKNLLKVLLILPVLAIFLVSFNTKEIYIATNSESDTSWVYENPEKTIKIVIDKNMTDKELKELKKDLADKGIDFSYTVVHNSKNEITSISIDFAAENNGSQTKSSSSFNNDDQPIDPIHIVYNPDTNSISMGNGKKYAYRCSSGQRPYGVGEFR